MPIKLYLKEPINLIEKQRDVYVIDITYDCKNDCITCPMLRKQPIYIDAHKLHHLLDVECINNRCENATATISGGEPFLHKDFNIIVKLLSNYFKNIIIQTHPMLEYAPLIFKQLITELSQTNINIFIQVSLYGYDDHTYRILTRRNWFFLTNKNICSIIDICSRSANCFIELRFVIHKLIKNNDIDKLLNYINELITCSKMRQDTINSVRVLRFNCLDPLRINLRLDVNQEVQMLNYIISRYFSYSYTGNIPLRISTFSESELDILNILLSMLDYKKYKISIMHYYGNYVYIGPAMNIRKSNYSDIYLKIEL
ncbi:hypothetical protein JCM14467A_07390 [Vulcanisaeta sp. JCM 14467]